MMVRRLLLCGLLILPIALIGRPVSRAQTNSGQVTYLTQFGNSSLNFPTGIAVDDIGNVYVADTGNSRVVKFDPTGAVAATFGLGGRNGNPANPTGVAVD